MDLAALEQDGEDLTGKVGSVGGASPALARQLWPSKALPTPTPTQQAPCSRAGT